MTYVGSRTSEIADLVVAAMYADKLRELLIEQLRKARRAA